MRLLLVGLVLAAIGHAEGVSRVVQKMGTDPVFAKHGIKVAPAAVDRRMQPFLGVVHPALKPHMLVVENGSNATIVEIHTIMYRYATPDGLGQAIPGISQMLLDPQAGVKPGDFFIVGEAGLSQAIMAQVKEGKSPPPGLANQQAEFVASNLDARRFSLAETVVDAIVLSDKRVLGPDRAGVVARQQAALRAKQQVLQKLEDPKVSDAELKEWLSQQVALRHRGPIDPQTMLPAHERSQLWGFAAAVDRQLKVMPRAQIAVGVERMISGEITNQLIAVKE